MNTHDKIVKCRSCGYVGPCDPTCCEQPDYDGATAEEAWKAADELLKHLKAAHSLIENTEAFGRTAPHGILQCGDSTWNIDDSKAAIVAYEAQPAEPVKPLSEEIIEAVKAYGLAYSTPNTTATELTIRLQDIRALLYKYGTTQAKEQKT